MTMMEAVKASAESDKPFYRQAWGERAKLYIDPEKGILRPGKWEEKFPIPDALWSPTMRDILDDDWVLADG